MTTAIIRRRKLGRTSCREIVNRTHNPFAVVRSWKDDFPKDTKMVIRWGCTGMLGFDHVPVLNTATAISEVNDKLEFRRKLNREKLCPSTWFSIEDVKATLRHLGDYPLVVRPQHHAQGRHFHVCRTMNELKQVSGRYKQFYASELVNKVAEYRVFIVCGRVVCVAQKTPGNPEEIAWNVARGGRFDNVRWDNWPLKVLKNAVKAFNLSSLHFGGVDVMVDDEGRADVVEINSAPSLTSPYRQTCMAKAFDYVVDKGKEKIPVIQEPGGYRKWIHPAVCDNAILVNN